MELEGILQRKHKNLLKLKMISKLLRAPVMLFAIKDKHHAYLLQAGIRPKDRQIASWPVRQS